VPQSFFWGLPRKITTSLSVASRGGRRGDEIRPNCNFALNLFQVIKGRSFDGGFLEKAGAFPGGEFKLRPVKGKKKKITGPIWALLWWETSGSGGKKRTEKLEGNQTKKQTGHKPATRGGFVKRFSRDVKGSKK